MNLDQSIERMTDCICVILEQDVHSIWLYGSVVMNDFRPGFGHCLNISSKMKHR